MCAVSMVVGGFQDQYPAIGRLNVTTATDMLDVIRRLEALDKKLDLICKDDRKDAYIKALEDRIRDLTAT